MLSLDNKILKIDFVFINLRGATSGTKIAKGTFHSLVHFPNGEMARIMPDCKQELLSGLPGTTGSQASSGAHHPVFSQAC